MDDCLLWTGYIDRYGYGQEPRPVGGTRKAHRVAYERAHGPIPEGMTVDHLCFTRACVNPEHLRLLTHLENSSNQQAALKTHCVNGHEYTPENTYDRSAERTGGRRRCRICNAAAARRSAERKRGMAA